MSSALSWIPKCDFCGNTACKFYKAHRRNAWEQTKYFACCNLHKNPIRDDSEGEVSIDEYVIAGIHDS